MSEATLMVMGVWSAELLAALLADSLEDGAALEDDDAASLDDAGALDAALDDALDVSAAALVGALVAGALVVLEPLPLFELQALATRTVRAPTAARSAVLRRDIVSWLLASG